MENRALYIFITAVVLCIVVVAAGGGLFQQSSPYFLQWQHRLFADFCHQDPARSLWLNGQPMAVCSRCFGIYSLFGAGWMSLPLFSTILNNPVKKGKIFVLAAIALNLLDIVGNYLGFWQNTPYSRLALGGLLGISAVMMFVNEFISLKIKQTGDADGTTRTTANAG